VLAQVVSEVLFYFLNIYIKKKREMFTLIWIENLVKFCL
jgi:hypothetical protein